MPQSHVQVKVSTEMVQDKKGVSRPHHRYIWVDLTRYTGEKLKEIAKEATNFLGKPRR